MPRTTSSGADLDVARVNRSSAIVVAAVTAIAGVGAGIVAKVNFSSTPQTQCVADDFQNLAESLKRLNDAWGLKGDTAKICGENPEGPCRDKVAGINRQLDGAQKDMERNIAALKAKCVR